MSEERKVSILSDKSVNLLSRLNDCFEKHNISERNNSGVLNVENLVYKNQITWAVNVSDLEKTESGKCLTSPVFYVEFLNIKYLWLEMYPKTGTLPLTTADLFLCFKNVPENMYIQCDAVILNNNKDIVWEERLCETAGNIKQNKIGFNAFVGLERQRDNLQRKMFIQCRIKLVSARYGCTSGKQEYHVNETPKIDHSMENILKSGKYSDVVLKVGDSKKKSHKCILASKSSTLRIWLKLNLENEHELENEEDATLTDVLNFIYTEDIKILHFQHAWKLYIAGYKYDIPKLKELCSAYLNANLTEKNISYVLDLAREKEDDHLLQACIEFIKKHDIDPVKKAFLTKFTNSIKK